MEQDEKIEKPKWVASVETLPEIVRQQVGTTCAGIISSLTQIWLIDHDLYFDVLDAVHDIVDAQLSDRESNENV